MDKKQKKILGDYIEDDEDFFNTKANPRMDKSEAAMGFSRAGHLSSTVFLNRILSLSYLTRQKPQSNEQRIPPISNEPQRYGYRLTPT